MHSYRRGPLAMLKITVHHTPEALRFQLEGRLVGAWVTEFEKCWLSAASASRARHAVVDLRDVTFIDDAGKTLLRCLGEKHVDFIARDTLTRAIVDEICDRAAKPIETRRPVAFRILARKS